MSTIQKMVNELDTEMTRVYEKYTNLHKELDTHRGKPIDDTNLDEVNRLLKEIQDVFAELYPAYHFVAHRYQFVSNATNSYNEFIDLIKKSGATANGMQN